MHRDFGSFFRAATGSEPFPWQAALALGGELPDLVRVPTGAGKTEGAALGWLWRRRFAEEAVRHATPRRLVYCLPMRVLVEQTVKRLREQLDRAGQTDLQIHQLMGGAVDRDWIDRPEDDAILVGTLDQLLSRALMRGYGESRYRWPIEFGLLHTDALWVCDEVQLFGEGLATSAQLEGFRRNGPPGPGPSGTLWMSATVEPEWLATVDCPAPGGVLELSAQDRTGDLEQRLVAEKRLSRIDAVTPAAVLDAHQAGTLTLVVTNTVKTARELFARLDRHKGLGEIDLMLLHSRFRPPERAVLVERLLSRVPGSGRIVVATQVVEAGVDISAATLITEAAPWASLVQRFGRCNRRGEIPAAQVLWAAPARPAPYDPDELTQATATLSELEGTSVSPDGLAQVHAPIQRPPRRNVIRRRDFLGLFDTAPDLSGADLDVSRFVRDTDDMSASLAWRPLGDDPPDDDEPRPSRDELCSVALGELRDVMARPHAARVYRFDHIDGRWVTVQPRDVRPGDRLITPLGFGCYSPTLGFDPRHAGEVTPIGSHAVQDEAVGADNLSVDRGVWLSLADHTAGVCSELDALIRAFPQLSETECQALRHAARRHDHGKAHHVFQEALRGDGAEVPSELPERALVAKRRGRGTPYARPGFRHELASLLAYLPGPDPDPLVAYLVAGHHGRIRLGARSLPGEAAYGRVLGCEAGDSLPPADLGDGIVADAIDLDLTRLDLGRANGETYTDLALGLLERIGPVRLAFLEAVLRTADRRRSAKEAACA